MTEGGNLVTIDDAAENAWLLSTFAQGTSDGIWIGYNDATTEGTYVWESGEVTGYNNFITTPETFTKNIITTSGPLT